MFRPSVVLVTGGAGFIGSNLVRWVLENEADVRVVNLDALTYAGNLESLADVTLAYGPEGDDRYFFVQGDIRDSELVASLLAGQYRERSTGRAIPRPDAVLHLAAESHVDRSILGPAPFVDTNVQGTLNILESVRADLAARPRPFRLVNVSTDEVYGSLAEDAPPFNEGNPLAPNSPYSASKAGADCLVRAYAKTYDLPCLTTRCSNNYGPFQFPEKLIPLTITRATSNQPCPVYGDGLNIRDWLYVNDHASAIWMVCTKGRLTDELYNIGGQAELANIDVVRHILDALGKPHSLISFVRDRPGHDRRYAVETSRISSTVGWQPSVSFTEGLAATIEWYLANESWWRRVESEAYRASRELYFNSVRA